uniref:Uncharacterized protein n=1 Tax=Populus trichocarpa TaxID=3694 RepID=A0A2K2AY43_POPTR
MDVKKKKKRRRKQREKLKSKDFSNDFDQLDVAPGLTPDFVQVRNVRNGNMLYDLSLLSYTVLTFAKSSDFLSAQRDAMVEQELCPAQLNSPIAADDSLFTNTSHPVLSNLNASPTANNGDAQECGNWRKLGSEQSYDLSVDYAGVSVIGERNQKLMYAGEPDYNEQRDTELQSSLVNPSYEFSSQDNQKQFTTHSLYQNTLQDVVASGLIGSTKECILHPTSGNHSTALHFNNFNAWIRKPTENPIRGVMSWFLIQGRGKTLHNLPGNATNVQNTGLLGPFTGYSTILNSSRFLKPAQELLEEFCEARWRARPPRLSDTVNESDTGDEANGDNNLGASLFYFRRSNEEFGDCGVGNISSESYMPEYRQMKAKRLLLLDEAFHVDLFSKSSIF